MTKVVECVLTEIMAMLPAGHPYLMLPPDRYKRLMAMKRRGRLKDRVMRCPDESWSKPIGRIRDRARRIFTERTGKVMKHLTFHDLRRTCITEWSMELPPHEVLKLSGLSDMDILLNHYAGYGQSSMARARCVSSQNLPMTEGHGPLKQTHVPKELTAIGATGLEPATS